jgi:hypothetical protein
LALVCLAAPALAETSAREVWQAIQTEVSDAGGSLTAASRPRSDGMVLAGGRLTLRSGVVLVLPDVTLQEAGDGSVSLALPPQFPLVIDLPPKSGDPDKVALQVEVADLFAQFRDVKRDAGEASFAATSITVTPDPRDETARALMARSGVPGAAEVRVDVAGALDLVQGWPVGTVTVDLVGIRALLDGLAAIGAVSEDDLLGLRMGLAATTRPGTGPDQVVSQIELRADGGVFVNGVQLR